ELIEQPANTRYDIFLHPSQISRTDTWGHSFEKICKGEGRLREITLHIHNDQSGARGIEFERSGVLCTQDSSNLFMLSHGPPIRFKRYRPFSPPISLRPSIPDKPH